MGRLQRRIASPVTISQRAFSQRAAALLACLALLPAGSALAQGRGASKPAAPAALLPQSWWNRTTMRAGKESPSRHYAIRSDLSQAETRAYSHHLDLLFAEYQKRLAGLEQRGPNQLNVFMFARRADYHDTLRTQFGIDASGSGGMFFVTPRGAGLAFFVEGLPRSRVEHVIQHEGFHQVAYGKFMNDLPIWINEGLAEFFGEAVVVGDDVIIGQSTARTLDTLKAAIERGATIPFLEMLTMTPEGWGARVKSGSAALQYQQAWSMAHFLVYGENGRFRPAFERYLHHLNNGSTSVDAFRKAFGSTDLTDFENRWKAYAAAATPSALATALERMQFLAEGMLALRKEGKFPKDLDELQGMLKEAKFTLALERHGHLLTLSAEDPGAFEIPDDEHSKTPPTFALEPFKLKNASLKERKQEAESPTPPALVTKGLKPRELVVRWKRTDDGFTYDLDGK